MLQDYNSNIDYLDWMTAPLQYSQIIWLKELNSEINLDFSIIISDGA